MKNNEHNEIARRLERFMAGESTLDEEQTLQRYFATHRVPPHWRAYQQMFAYFDAGMPLTGAAAREAVHHSAPRLSVSRRWMHWGGVAASLALLASVGWHLLSQTGATDVVPSDTLAKTVDNYRVVPIAAEQVADTPAVATPLQPEALAHSRPRAAATKRAKAKTTSPQRLPDSVEVSRTQGALEAAEQEVIADRILLERELRQAQPEAGGWVTVSLNIQ